MQTIPLGTQGLHVSPVGLGCMGMTAFYGSRDDTESIATIHAALDAGINLFDTADMYGPHTNEQLLGQALQGRRDQAIIATKFGIQTDPNDSSKRRINGRPDYIRQSCEDSLQHLQVDHIDLYYQHRVDNQVPIEESVGAMAELIQEGKIRHIGLSEAGSQTLRRAHAEHPITALQTEYSLWSREPEAQLQPTCAELGIGFVAYSPLGRGFLTGQIQRFEDFAADDYRRHTPRFQGDNFQKNLQLVRRVQDIAQTKGVTAAQLALAWVLHQPKHILPVFGTKKRAYLQENLGALSIQLSQDEQQQLQDAIPSDQIAGSRYPSAWMSHLNR